MLRALEAIIADSKNIVFFGGAGVSTESGIPDFRSVDGLYHQKYDYPPETILSHTFWEQHPEEFYRFYRDKMIVGGPGPMQPIFGWPSNTRSSVLKAVVTQNIDGLHQAAGSKTSMSSTAAPCGITAWTAANSTGWTSSPRAPASPVPGLRRHCQAGCGAL